jgi:hypothetical protein
MSDVSHKRCTLNNKNYIQFVIENLAVNEIMWKNMAQPGTQQMTIWHKLTACWIPKAANKHSECVTLTALPLQQ